MEAGKHALLVDFMQTLENYTIKKLYIQTNTNFDLNVITCTQVFKETVSISIKQWNQYLQLFSILHSTSENKALYLKDVFVKV